MMMTERGHLSSHYRICLTNTEFAKLCSMSAIVAIHSRLFSTWNLVDIQGSLEVIISFDNQSTRAMDPSAVVLAAGILILAVYEWGDLN
ncbi:hypothetical protein ACLB2K_014361 [Fragaria x ananassa]